MAPSQGTLRPPVILIANDQEWAARSLDSVLGAKGFAVLRSQSGRQTLELARTTQPDAIILDIQLPESGGLDVCRALRDDPLVGGSVPILVTAGGGARSERLAAFAAGAWDYCTQPIDGEVLLSKLAVYLRAKRDVDRWRDSSLVDDVTGLYSIKGLARRAEEIGAAANRYRQPLACIAFSVVEDGRDVDTPASGRSQRIAIHVGRLCRSHSRASDALGRTGTADFALLAPLTDPPGAARLIARLRTVIESTRPTADADDLGSLRAWTSHHAVIDYSVAQIDAMEMLLRATSDLRLAKAAFASVADVPLTTLPSS